MKTFIWKALALVSLASRGSVLGKAVLGLGLEFFCVQGLEPCVLEPTSANFTIALSVFVDVDSQI